MPTDSRRSPVVWSALVMFLVACGGADDQPMEVPAIDWDPRRYICYRSGDSITIDGRLDETPWQVTEWTAEFVDIRGESYPAPRYGTRAAMLWDDKYFYIAAQIEEPRVWATLRERDSVIFQDNDFEAFIDPDGDTHEYYELEINAFVTEWDLLLTRPYRDAGQARNDWDLDGLKTAVEVQGTINDPSDEDRGWTVEIAIPWVAIARYANRPTPPGPGDQWRVNFSRVEWQVDVTDGAYVKRQDPATGEPLPEDNWVWSPQGLIAMHYPEMWAFVQFSTHAAGRGDDAFVERRIESAKWALRRLYYAQDRWHAEHGRFSDDPAELGMAGPAPEGFGWPPAIVLEPNGYVAALTTDAGSTVRIRRDGRVW